MRAASVVTVTQQVVWLQLGGWKKEEEEDTVEWHQVGCRARQELCFLLVHSAPQVQGVPAVMLCPCVSCGCEE